MTPARRRLLFVALAFCAAAVCVAILMLTDGGSSVSTKTLPDGSVLTVRRITKGTNHRCVIGSLVQRAAGRVLPESWSKKLGAQVVNCISSNDTHVLWLEHSGVAKTNRYPIFSSIRITTDAGFDRLCQYAVGLTPPSREVRGFWFDPLPTDSPYVQVTVGNPGDRSSWVTLQVRNPAFVPRRQWPARPCPTSVEQDHVSLELERFARGPQNPASAWSQPSTELSFVIRDRAVPTNNWFARTVRVFNEPGVEFLPPFRPVEAWQGRTRATFPGGLSSTESYKLCFELRRTTYGPDEHHTFVAVPVPVANGPHSRPQPAKLQGFTLLLVLSAKGEITARIEPPTRDWRLDPVRVVDDRGRWLHPRGESSFDGQFSGSVPLEPDTATVDLTFGLARQRTIEVIAQPSLAK